jgi:hypothetical protein
MKSLHVEILMGHNVGLAENYYRPNERELLEDYLKAIPDMMIVESVQNVSLNEDIESLKHRIEKLEEDRKKDKAILAELLRELKQR